MRATTNYQQNHHQQYSDDGGGRRREIVYTVDKSRNERFGNHPQKQPSAKRLANEIFFRKLYHEKSEIKGETKIKKKCLYKSINNNSKNTPL